MTISGPVVLLLIFLLGILCSLTVTLVTWCKRRKARQDAALGRLLGRVSEVIREAHEVQQHCIGQQIHHDDSYSDDELSLADDCGDTRGLHIHLTKDNAKSFVYRNIIVDGKLVELTPDVIDQYIGTTVKIRSALYCLSTKGYCSACTGNIFNKLFNVLAALPTPASPNQWSRHGIDINQLRGDVENLKGKLTW